MIRTLAPLLLVACTAGSDTSEPTDTDPSTEPVGPCEALDLPVATFDEGPYGLLRREVAEDFTVEDQNGLWNLREQWTGCETYVFVPDGYSVSSLDDTSFWRSDLDELIAQSPLNVHWFFVSTASDAETKRANFALLEPQVDELLDGLEPGDAPGQQDWWTDRIHLVQQRAERIDGWPSLVIPASGSGRSTSLGFGIDRFQRLRGFGNLADVERFSPELDAAGGWPWEDNMSAVAHEPTYWNYEAERQARLDAEQDVTVVTVWDGEVLAEYADIEVELPSAADMAGFDTLEFDLTANCPSQSEIEFGNCGAWDYLAHIFVQDDSEAWVELARFITTYHREGRYLVDASQMLPHLASGGTRTFRYSFAPSWNTQPTETVLHFRFSNRAKTGTPTDAHYLFSGGGFGSHYNEIAVPIDPQPEPDPEAVDDNGDPIVPPIVTEWLPRPDVEVEIPADAVKVELWSIITGHGMDTNNCAEFCNHEHAFTIGDQTWFKDWPAVGNSEGCVEQIGMGTVPNQSGTWWFGRGGWCPGKQVDPWVEDVTAAAAPGTTVSVGYRGSLGGQTPPDNAGTIHMVSYLVVYR